MLKRFVLHTGGAIAPLFAIAAIPMLCAMGAAVDFSRAYQERTVIQDALDAAALSGGRDIGVKTTDQIKVDLTKYYLANVGTKIQNPPTLVPNIAGGTITINTQLHVPTFFLRIIGLNEVVFNMTTQAKAGMGTLEVALVLDNSTSMCLGCNDADQNSTSTKIGTLKKAATDLTNKLFQLETTSTQPDPVKMALVPFAASVNVGASTALAAGWVDTAGQGTYVGQAQKNEGAAASLNPYTQFATVNVPWGGCLEERPAPYDVDDTEPAAATPGTLYVPMFAPDEPDSWNCSTTTCNYIGTTTATRRYNGVPTSGNQTYNNYLPDAGASGGACGTDIRSVTMTKAIPTVFTSTGHGFTAGTEIVFNSTNSLYTGVTGGASYYVAPATTTNTFMASTSSTGDTVTVTNGTSSTFTVTRASPAVFSSNNHGMAAGTAIKLSTTGAMYSPLSNGGTYYVISAGLNTNVFRVSTSSGGSAVNTTGSQSGTHSYVKEAIFTRNNHGLSVGDAVLFTTTGALPSGISTNTVYYVRAVLDSNTFTVSATSGGGPIFPGTSQSGTHRVYPLVGTTGSQSGTHSVFRAAQTVNWTCENGSDNCGGTNNGKSQNKALAGINLSANQQCKYGTNANKASVPSSLSVGNIKGGPNLMCTTTAITPLTKTKATIVSAINAQKADGYTNITAGISWGLRVLSPDVPFTEGRAYSETQNLKVMIVMTDGENTYNPYMQSNQNPSTSTTAAGKFVKSNYGAWGYLYSGRFGTTSTTSSVVFTNLNARTSAACTKAKAAGIKVYTIAFQVTDSATLQMLSNCASDPAMAYQSSNNQGLLDAFTAIGESITSLRVSM